MLEFQFLCKYTAVVDALCTLPERGYDWAYGPFKQGEFEIRPLSEYQPRGRHASLSEQEIQSWTGCAAGQDGLAAVYFEIVYGRYVTETKLTIFI